jgi:DMSO/TMAO reductase YedYZ molybdopterin-dependent catalytic subunit
MLSHASLLHRYTAQQACQVRNFWSSRSGENEMTGQRVNAEDVARAVWHRLRKGSRNGLAGLALLCTLTPVVFAQPDLSKLESSLSVAGEVSTPLTLTAAELARLPRQVVKVSDRQGKLLVYEGVALTEVLRRAGAPLGESLKGEAMSTYLLVEARDGYRVVFALAELDPAFANSVVLLADRRDGQPLDALEGPLRLVVPAERRQARWVRQVRRLVIRRAAPEK